MKLIYLYGPPASGKFTVGTELARLTGYKLFHNHLSIAAVEPVFDFGSETFWRLVDDFREAVFSAAAQEGVDLIYTGVYADPDDISVVNRRFDLVEIEGGEVCLIRLTCDPRVIESRLPSQSRADMHKLTAVEAFRANNLAKDISSAIPGRPSLLIDTTSLSPEDAAMRIIRHYRLMGDDTL